MILKNNFSRFLVMFILCFFNNLCLAIPFVILRNFYNVSFMHTLLIFLFIGLYCRFYCMDYSVKIFKKYCNFKCDNCNMWHCELSTKK